MVIVVVEHFVEVIGVIKKSCLRSSYFTKDFFGGGNI